MENKFLPFLSFFLFSLFSLANEKVVGRCPSGQFCPQADGGQVKAILVSEWVREKERKRERERASKGQGLLGYKNQVVDIDSLDADTFD